MRRRVSRNFYLTNRSSLHLTRHRFFATEKTGIASNAAELERYATESTMKKIPENGIRGWTKVAGKQLPRAVALCCPHCSQLGVFTLVDHLDDPRRAATSATGKCPACQNHVGFWAINERGEESADVYFHPDNNDFHEITRINPGLPPLLVRAYESTVDAYNAGNYPAAAVCCRRTLEGIFKYLLPEEKRGLPLAKAIEVSAEHVDFTMPIRKLSDVLRKGGNLGAHFDMETEPDEHVTKAMVELLEYLIAYLHVLPRQIEELEHVLDGEA